MHSLDIWNSHLYIKELSCDACKVNCVCKNCFSKPGGSNENIIKETEGASEESDGVSDLHDNNGDGQSDADNSKESKDEDDVVDR